MGLSTNSRVSVVLFQSRPFLSEVGRRRFLMPKAGFDWRIDSSLASDFETGEFSVEANPIHIDLSLCSLLLRSLGINRLSIGAQSFQQDKLKRLDRDHSPEQLEQAIEIARKHFDNVSLDLIFGSPEEKLLDWTVDLGQAVERDVQHHINLWPDY